MLGVRGTSRSAGASGGTEREPPASRGAPPAGWPAAATAKADRMCCSRSISESPETVRVDLRN